MVASQRTVIVFLLDKVTQSKILLLCKTIGPPTRTHFFVKNIQIFMKYIWVFS